GTGIAAAAVDRGRGELGPAGEQMHGAGPGLERDRGGVKSRGGAADDRHRPAAQRGKNDILAGMGIEGPWQRRGDLRRHIGAAAAVEPGGDDDLARGLDRLGAGAAEVQAEMPRYRLDPREPGAVTHRDAEKIAIPREVVGPGLARDALERGIGGGA